MPSIEDHFSHAARSRRLIELLRQQAVLPEWAAIGAFIKALHYVEALLALDKKHSTSHKDRKANMIGQGNKYKTIFKHYDPLKRMSLRARYLAGNIKPDPSDDNNFDKVWSEFICHHLQKLCKSVTKLGEKYAPKSKRKHFKCESFS